VSHQRQPCGVVLDPEAEALQTRAGISRKGRQKVEDHDRLRIGWGGNDRILAVTEIGLSAVVLLGSVDQRRIAVDDQGPSFVGPRRHRTTGEQQQEQTEVETLYHG